MSNIFIISQKSSAMTKVFLFRSFNRCVTNISRLQRLTRTFFNYFVPIFYGLSACWTARVVRSLLYHKFFLLRNKPLFYFFNYRMRFFFFRRRVKYVKQIYIVSRLAKSLHQSFFFIEFLRVLGPLIVFRGLYFYNWLKVLKFVINRLRTKFFLFKNRLATSIGTAKSLYRAQLKTEEEPHAILLGDVFFGKSFFNLYLITGFKVRNSFYFFKQFFHVYSFFLWRVNVQLDFLFFSFISNKILVHLMLNGNKVTVESLFLSLFQSFKMLVNLPVSLIIINAIVSSKMVLNRTHIFLSGRGHMVPTPSIFDKQYKSGVHLIKVFMRKRQYLRDVLKRSLVAGRYVGRRTPLYKNISRLSVLFIKTQSFFVLLAARKQNSRFLKNDVFNSIRKNIYMFILQRTYIQYRWR